MTGDDRTPLDLHADEVAGTLAARRQLGPDSEDAVIAAFLDRAGQAIDRRVDERVGRTPVHVPVESRHHDDRDARKDARNLAIWSVVMAFPITGVSTQFGDAGPVVAIASWFGIGAINLIFNRRHRR